MKAAVLSGDGKHILTAAGKAAILWDGRSGKQIRALNHADRVFDVTFSPDSKRIATGSLDKTARTWDADTGKQLSELKHEDGVRFVEFSPDGNRLVVGTVFTGDEPGTERWPKPRQINVDDRFAPGDVWVWDLARQKKIATLVRDQEFCYGRPVFSPDSAWLAIPVGWHGVRVLNVKTDTAIAGWYFVCGYRGDTSVSFTGDGKRLLVVGDDGSSVLDAAAHLLEFVKFDEPSDDDQSTHELKEVKGFHPNEALYIGTISADGKTMAFGGTCPGVWDVATNKQLVHPYVEPGRNRGQWNSTAWQVTSIALSPKADFFAIGFTEMKWDDDRRVAVGSTYTAVWPIKRPAK